MKVYVIHGGIDGEDFEWIESVYQTLKAANKRVKALEKDLSVNERKRYYYRVIEYEVQET